MQVSHNRVQSGERDRIHFLDIAKGIGIICVAIGHCLPFCPLRYWIYGFHVPLFFVISGIVCDFDRNTSRSFICKRVRGLFIPFLFWYAFQILLFVIIGLDGLEGKEWKFHSIWFIWILFITEIISLIIYKYLKKITSIVIPFSLIVVLAQQYFQIDSFLYLDSLAAAMFFFWFGYKYKCKILSFVEWLAKYKLYAVLWGVIAFIISLIRVYLEHRGAIVGNRFSIDDYFTSLVSIVSILLLCRCIHRHRLLEYLGRNTIVILAVHYSVIYLAVSYVDPLMNHQLFKIVQQILIWGSCILSINIVNKFLPWAAGKYK